MLYTELLQKLNPDADSLIPAISRYVDDAMLMDIAIKDYGDDVEGYLEQLRKIRDEHIVSIPWLPQEVLELTGWLEPEKVYEGVILTPEAIRRGHIMRVFACAILLRARAEPTEPIRVFVGDDNQLVASLLDSLPSLEPFIQSEALRFFAWRIQHFSEDHGGHEPFYVLGLLILVLRTQANLTPTELNDLIEWIYRAVGVDESDEFMQEDTSDQWLTWLTFFNQRHEIWKTLGQEIATSAEVYEDDLRKQLKDLASHLESTSFRLWPPPAVIDQWIAELSDPQIPWADQLDKMRLVSSTQSLRAIKPLASFLYILACNGYSAEVPPEFLQIMGDLVKHEEGKQAAEEVLAVMTSFQDKEPSDPEENKTLGIYRRWLVDALVELGDVSIEPLKQELPDFHPNKTPYIELALSRLSQKPK